MNRQIATDRPRKTNRPGSSLFIAHGVLCLCRLELGGLVYDEGMSSRAVPSPEF